MDLQKAVEILNSLAENELVISEFYRNCRN